jgi:hypothetical protein
MTWYIRFDAGAHRTEVLRRRFGRHITVVVMIVVMVIVRMRPVIVDATLGLAPSRHSLAVAAFRGT